MISRLRTFSAQWLLFALFCAAPFMSGQAQQIATPDTRAITVGTNVHVSKPGADQFFFEVQMAADPENPKNLLACSMVRDETKPRGHFRVVAYSSFDGGASWQETLSDNGSQEGAADPTCAFGPNSMAYLSALSINDRKLSFFKSVNAGKTWIAAPTWVGLVDRPYITVDNASGKYRGRVYLNALMSLDPLDIGGKGISEIDLWRSDNLGDSMIGPARRTATNSNRYLQTGPSVVLSDGTLVTIGGQSDDNRSAAEQEKPCKHPGRIFAISSKDGGETFQSPAATVSQWCTYLGTPEYSHAGLSDLAADSTSGRFKDRLYAVWTEFRTDRMTVMLSYSSDQGKKWSTPVVVDDTPPDAKNGDAFTPSVAVNSSGVVGVMWYDRRDNVDNLGYYLGYWPRFSASLDGGERFLPSVKVSEAPSSFQIPKLTLAYPRQSPRRLGGGRLNATIGIDSFQFGAGDTSGLDASPDGVFHPLWVDNRTGIPQVWTAPVTISKKAIQQVSERLPLTAAPVTIGNTATLQFSESATSEVSDAVELIFGQPEYDRSKHLITVDASLKNISRQSLPTPLSLEVLTLKSEIGHVSIANSDNGLDRVGAVWNFSDQIENGVLNPGAQSKPKRLQFRVTEEADRVEKSWTALSSMIQLAVKVVTRGNPQVYDVPIMVTPAGNKYIEPYQQDSREIISDQNLRNAIYNKDIEPLISRSDVVPDWDFVQKQVVLKHGLPGTEVVWKAKVNYYFRLGDWSNFHKAFSSYVSRYGTERFNPIELNDTAWGIFEKVSDRKILEVALSLSQLSLQKAKGQPSLAKFESLYLDTYANILHRLGKTKEAIEWEEKALKLATTDADKKIFRAVLDKMKKGEPTWPIK